MNSKDLNEIQREPSVVVHPSCNRNNKNYNGIESLKLVGAGHISCLHNFEDNRVIYINCLCGFYEIKVSSTSSAPIFAIFGIEDRIDYISTVRYRFG